MMPQSLMVILYTPRCLDYAAASHPESPERIRPTVARLQREFHTWELPTPCTDEDILRVHTRGLLEAARTGAFEDADTPFFPQILEIAKLSAGAAILAAEHALAGRPAFSLMRPPGHHAERDRIMGFCYLNNIAIAIAKIFHSSPHIQRVAILDFDCHHGNGTENIFRGDGRVLFVSLHQSPCYPGTGLASKGNVINYPLPPGTGPEKFLAALDDALVLIGNFKPQLLAVSAGFDAYRDDPITHMNLDVETFQKIGQRIAHLTNSPTASALPCFAVLEGGYSREFHHCVDAFLAGWEQH